MVIFWSLTRGYTDNSVTNSGKAIQVIHMYPLQTLGLMS